MTRRALFFIAGFFLAGSGLYALILSLVGVKLNYLVWMDAAGPLPGFLGRVLMIMIGAVLIVLGATDWDRERADIARYEAERQNSAAAGTSN